MSLIVERAVVDSRMQLVLNSSHNELVSSWLVWYFFRTDPIVAVGYRALLSISCLSRLLVSLCCISCEIEDVLLDGRERVVVTDIEASCRCLLLLLTVHVDLNLWSFN